MSRRDSDSEKVPAALYDRLTDTPTYAARMYKVQADVLRAGGTARVLGFTAKAPSTLGTFLRSFSWGHVRQLDRVGRELLARAWAAGAGPGDGPLTIGGFGLTLDS